MIASPKRIVELLAAVQLTWCGDHLDQILPANGSLAQILDPAGEILDGREKLVAPTVSNDGMLILKLPSSPRSYAYARPFTTSMWSSWK